MLKNKIKINMDKNQYGNVRGSSRVNDNNSLQHG